MRSWTWTTDLSKDMIYTIYMYEKKQENKSILITAYEPHVVHAIFRFYAIFSRYICPKETPK